MVSIPDWKQGGQCRIVCRPNRKQKRCYTARDVQRIIGYSLQCTTADELCTAVKSVLPCECEKPDCSQIQRLLDEAIDFMLEIQGNEGLIELRALLGWILDNPPPDPGGQLNAFFIPAWLSRAWSLIQYAWFLWRLYRLAQEVIDVIDIINPTLDLLRELQTALGDICNDSAHENDT